MKPEQQQQAQHLYFQTDMSKSEIAATVGSSRRTLHYWVEQNNWDRLKKSGQCIPSFLAENCYQVLGNLTEHLLSEERIGQPVTPQEVNSMYKLTLTIGKLKNKATLNENMETFASFTDHLLQSAPALAELLAPHIDTFIQNQSAPNHTQCRPSKLNDSGFIPTQPKATADKEALLDLEDQLFWAEEARKKNATNTHPSAPDPAPITQPGNTTKPTATHQPPKQSPSPSAPSPLQTTPRVTPPAPPTMPTAQESGMRGEAAARGKLPRILRHAA